VFGQSGAGFGVRGKSSSGLVCVAVASRLVVALDQSPSRPRTQFPFSLVVESSEMKTFIMMGFWLPANQNTKLVDEEREPVHIQLDVQIIYASGDLEARLMQRSRSSGISTAVRLIDCTALPAAGFLRRSSPDGTVP
jgi:hypothetical protein